MVISVNNHFIFLLYRNKGVKNEYNLYINDSINTSFAYINIKKGKKRKYYKMDSHKYNASILL